VLAGVVVGKRVKKDRRGREMAFVKMADFDGDVEAVFFSDIYSESKNQITDEVPLVIRGSKNSRGNAKIVVEKALSLQDARNTLIDGITIEIDSARPCGDALKRLKELLALYPGDYPVTFKVKGEETEVVTLRPKNLRVSLSSELLNSANAILGEGNARLSAKRL